MVFLQTGLRLSSSYILKQFWKNWWGKVSSRHRMFCRSNSRREFQGNLCRPSIPFTSPPAWAAAQTLAKKIPKKGWLFFTQIKSLSWGSGWQCCQHSWRAEGLGFWMFSYTLIFTYARMSVHSLFLLDFAFLEMREVAHYIYHLRCFMFSKKMSMRELC